MIAIPRCATILGLAGKKDDALAAAKELERIGVASNIYWNIISVFQRFIPKALYSSDFLRTPSMMSCNLGHYHIVQTALELGLDSIWVVEDDVCFLKDVDRLRSELTSVPEDADFLILDGLVTPRTLGYLDKNRPGWHLVHPALDPRSSGNYILNRRAMELYAKHITGQLTGKLPLGPDVGRDGRTLPGLRVYTAYPLLSIQRPAGDLANKRSSSQWDRCARMYSEMGLDLDAYGPVEK